MNIHYTPELVVLSSNDEPKEKDSEQDPGNALELGKP